MLLLLFLAVHTQVKRNMKCGGIWMEHSTTYYISGNVVSWHPRPYTPCPYCSLALSMAKIFLVTTNHMRDSKNAFATWSTPKCKNGVDGILLAVKEGRMCISFCLFGVTFLTEIGGCFPPKSHLGQTLLTQGLLVGPIFLVTWPVCFGVLIFFFF